MALRRHKVAYLHMGDLAADRRHIAAKLVPDNHGRFEATPRPRIPLIDMQIRATDRGAHDADENLLLSNRRFRNLAHRQPHIGLGFTDCLHREEIIPTTYYLLSLHGHAPAVVLAAERLGDMLQKLDAPLQLVGDWTVVGKNDYQPAALQCRLHFRLVAHILHTPARRNPLNARRQSRGNARRDRPLRGLTPESSICCNAAQSSTRMHYPLPTVYPTRYNSNR
jgi:hypothetical protein